MKYLYLVLIFFIGSRAIAQNDFSPTNSNYRPVDYSFSNHDFLTPKVDFSDFAKDTKLIAIQTANPYFHRSFMITQDGETISSGFMPSTYFMPNDNFIVISGKNTLNRDSYNPYGSTDLTSTIFFGTVNTFISKFKSKKR